MLGVYISVVIGLVVGIVVVLASMVVDTGGGSTDSDQHLLTGDDVPTNVDVPADLCECEVVKVCHSCHMANEESFSYCRSCAEKLSFRKVPVEELPDDSVMTERVI